MSITRKTKRRPCLCVPTVPSPSKNVVGLYNAPAIFQKRMMSIFSDMVGDFFEVFMDVFLYLVHPLRIVSIN